MKQRNLRLLYFLLAGIAGFACSFAFPGGGAIRLGGYSILVGIIVLVFSSPQTSPQARSIGWALTGFAVGALTPILLLLMFYAG